MNLERLKQHLAEYGPVAVGTYFAIFFLVLAGFAVAFSQGVQLAGVEVQGAENAGVLGAAYVATKLAQPARIAATLVLTPLVARVLRKVRGAAPASSDPAESGAPAPAAESVVSSSEP